MLFFIEFYTMNEKVRNFTVAEYAEYAGKSVPWVYQRIHDTKSPLPEGVSYIKIGKNTYLIQVNESKHQIV